MSLAIVCRLYAFNRRCGYPRIAAFKRALQTVRRDSKIFRRVN